MREKTKTILIMLGIYGSVIGIFMLLAFFAKPAYAGDFNFGTTTYEQVDDILIVNSLGDEVIESQFNYNDYKLGYNDYIPENAFKNAYYQDGYTRVYDFDDTSLDLVEVGYMGVKGDPRAYDTDYVLKKEWEKYSAQYQDVRISSNTNSITANKQNIITNTKNITKVDNKHTNWNQKQDRVINNNSNDILANTQRIGDIDSRLSDLEDTQQIVGGKVRVYDGKKWQVNLFADYSVNRNMVDRTGVRFTYKLGESYEERQIKKLEQRLEALEK